MRKVRLAINQNAFSLVEVILSTSLFVMLVTVLVGAYLYGQESTLLAGARARAVLIAEEGLEAVRNIRDENYSNLVDGTFGLALSGNIWTFSGSSDATDIFTRQIVIEPEGTNRKKVTSSVTWQQNAQRSGLVALVTRLTNWMAAGIGDWSNPFVEGTSGLPGFSNGWKIQVKGDYAYIVRSSGVPDFAIFDISDASNPALVGSLILSGGPRNIAISGNYAYVVSTSNSQEFQVLDISIPSTPVLVGTLGLSGSANGQGVDIVGNFAYMVRRSSGQNEFVVINVSNPILPTVSGSLNLGASGNEVVVIGNFAYVSSDHNSQELQVVNISQPSSPTLAGTLNLSGSQDADTITGFDDIVVLGMSNGDLFTINIANPSSPTILGSFDAEDNVNDLSLGNSNNYVFIASDENNAEFQVIDISTPANPSLVGSLNLSSDLNGIAYHEDKDRAFAASESNNQELIVIAPQ